MARALLTLDRDPDAYQLLQRWQLIADRFSYPSAEALAWAAMMYLEETSGRDVVVKLASEFLTQPIGATTFAVLDDRATEIESRMEAVIGMPLEDFHANWQQWLKAQSSNARVQSFMQSVPALRGVVNADIDTSGVRFLQAFYELEPQFAGQVQNLDVMAGRCVMKHDYLGPFDTEFDVSKDFEDEKECQTDVIQHSVNSVYASGDRVFVALDFEGGLFHQPIRLHAERIYICLLYTSPSPRDRG